MVLTYWAVGLAYMPLVMKASARQEARETPAAPTAPAVPAEPASEDVGLAYSLVALARGVTTAQLERMVHNLLTNALKFTPDDGAVCVALTADSHVVEVVVRDTGVGIAPEDQALVFEEFKQVGRDYTRKAEGTGLGLALTKRFVELHGGTIRVESTPGMGSTFTFTLPIQYVQ